MNPTISPLEFLLTNALCLAAGAVAVVVLQVAGRAVYHAGKRNADNASQPLPQGPMTPSKH